MLSHIRNHLLLKLHYWLLSMLSTLILPSLVVFTQIKTIVQAKVDRVNFTLMTLVVLNPDIHITLLDFKLRGHK